MLEAAPQTDLCRACAGSCRSLATSARCCRSPIRCASPSASISARRGTTIRTIRTTRRSACGLPVAVLVVPVVADRPRCRSLLAGAARRRARAQAVVGRRRCPTFSSRSGTASRRRSCMSARRLRRRRCCCCGCRRRLDALRPRRAAAGRQGASSTASSRRRRRRSRGASTRRCTRRRCRAMLAVIVATVVAVGVAGFLGGTPRGRRRGRRCRSACRPSSCGSLLMVACARAWSCVHRDRLLALVLTSVVGLDRLARLRPVLGARPRADADLGRGGRRPSCCCSRSTCCRSETPRGARPRRQLRDGAIAAAGGLGVGGLAYAVMTRDVSRPSPATTSRTSKPRRRRHQRRQRDPGRLPRLRHVRRDHRARHRRAGDLRAARHARCAARRRGGSTRCRHGVEAGDAPSAAARRGDAGAAAAGARRSASSSSCAATTSRAAASSPGWSSPSRFLMQYMASGYAWAAGSARVDDHALIGAGVLIAGAHRARRRSLFGRPFLTSAFGYFHLPAGRRGSSSPRPWRSTSACS